jgi:hypothetical protein
MAGMETNQTFNSNNDTFKIVQIKPHGENFQRELGWTHFAEVKRANGRKHYYANLLIVDGVLVQSKVLL